MISGHFCEIVCAVSAGRGHLLFRNFYVDTRFRRGKGDNMKNFIFAKQLFPIPPPRDEIWKYRRGGGGVDGPKLKSFVV